MPITVTIALVAKIRLENSSICSSGRVRRRSTITNATKKTMEMMKLVITTVLP